MTHKRGAHFLLRHRFLRLGDQVARRRFLPPDPREPQTSPSPGRRLPSGSGENVEVNLGSSASPGALPWSAQVQLLGRGHHLGTALRAPRRHLGDGPPCPAHDAPHRGVRAVVRADGVHRVVEAGLGVGDGEPPAASASRTAATSLGPSIVASLPDPRGLAGTEGSRGTGKDAGPRSVPCPPAWSAHWGLRRRWWDRLVSPIRRPGRGRPGASRTDTTRGNGASGGRW